MKKAAIICLVVLCCVGCDQATKGIARWSLPGSESISLLHDFIRLQLIENSGGFLSLGGGIYQDYMILRLGERQARESLKRPHVKRFDMGACDLRVLAPTHRLLQLELPAVFQSA